MIRHHESCACRLCRPETAKEAAGGRIRAELDVMIARRVEVVFDVKENVSIEDQAVDHARDQLDLEFAEEMEVRRVRCFANNGG